MRGAFTRSAVLLAASAASAPPPAWAAADPPPEDESAALHPVLTEVLFNVPKGEDGDADKDGNRDAAGDEFIEIFNPHDEPVALNGYTITSRLSTGDERSKRGIRFVFPDFELPAKAVAVVFNGYGSRIEAPVGSERKAPDGPNQHFSGAFVFTLAHGSTMNALANAGDFVLLSDPEGAPLDCVAWGRPDPLPPSGIERTAEVKADPKGSVQRTSLKGEFKPHVDIDRRSCSPGEFPGAKPPKPESDPAGAGPARR